jgi:hypothetical protein
MPIAVPRQPPVTLEGWVDYLGVAIDRQAVAVATWNDYYEGRHAVHYSQPKYQRAFGKMLDRFADNFCSLIVDSVTERLQVEGFRMTDDPAADKDAWAIWQANDMDAVSALGMTEALVSSRSYATVWGDSDGKPIIALEDPSEMVCRYDVTVDRVHPMTALKRWQDEWGTWHARLWTPSESVHLTSAGRSGGWVYQDSVPNPLGVVPVVELVNRPRLRMDPSSELMLVAPIQDAINKVVRDALVASEFAAYPQRYVTGLEIEVNEDGQPKPPPFDPALDRMFQAEDSAVNFGQFTAADLSNYVHLIDMLVQHLATVSRVPFHYFLINGGQAPSGEAIQSAEAGLVAKVRDRQVYFGNSWERVMRLCFRVLDDPRAQASGAETIWRDPEYRTEGQHIDALLKLKALGIPMKQLWEDAGYSPQQVDRFPQMRAELAGLALDPAVTP